MAANNYEESPVNVNMDTYLNSDQMDGAIEDRELQEDGKGLIYGLRDKPAWHLSFIFALQQISISVTGSITVPLITSELICAGHLEHVRSQLASTFLIMCGISTFLQVTIGTRLPIVQGGCSKFILPIMAMMTLERLKCKDIALLQGNGNMTNDQNGTDFVDMDDMWRMPLREIQGGIILASLSEMILGATGIIGALMSHIGPITIMPTITLVGLSLFDLGAKLCEPHWGLAILTIVLILLFSLYMGSIQVPFPSFSAKDKCHIVKYPIFKLLPIILAVLVAWLVSGVMTAAGVLPEDPGEKAYKARADAYVGALKSASWFFLPYPFQWGWPIFSVASFLGMMAATMTSIIESVGDYYACARICDVPPPPVHAVNRGITLEGLGGLFSGIFGSGGATTSYSQNIGAIGFTKVGSRRVFVLVSILFMMAGIFGKFGAILTMMPDPLLGGVLVIGLGMVSAVGISNLQFVDVASSRNQCIIGLSLMMGLILPNWLKKNPDAIDTGFPQLDQSIKVLLGTSMFVGGVVGFLLDNTVPGTDEERGLKKWRQDTSIKTSRSQANDNLNVTSSLQEKEMEAETDFIVHDSALYNIPFITSYLHRQRWARYVPVLPPFQHNRVEDDEQPKDCCNKVRTYFC